MFERCKKVSGPIVIGDLYEVTYLNVEFVINIERADATISLFHDEDTVSFFAQTIECSAGRNAITTLLRGGTPSPIRIEVETTWPISGFTATVRTASALGATSQATRYDIGKVDEKIVKYEEYTLLGRKLRM